MFQKPTPPAPQNPTADPMINKSHDEVETVVGPSVHVEGDFSSEGNILVKGIVSGNVRTSKLLTVEIGAKIFANVRAGSAVISGEIKGNVKVDEQLELTSSARVLGDIECKVLAVEGGALISGKIHMKGIDQDDGRLEKKGIVGRMKAKVTDSEDMNIAG